MRKLAALAFFLSSFTAYADMNQVIIFEQNLEQRIYRAIQKADPDAQVFAKVKLKDLSVQLPGVSSDFFGSAAISKIDPNDLSSINIRIITSLEPFPQSLRDELNRAYSIPNVKTGIEIVPYGPEVLNSIRNRNPIDLLFDRIGDWKMPLIVALGLFGAIAVTCFALLLLWIMSFWRGQVARVLSSLESNSETSSRPEALNEERSKSNDNEAKGLEERGLDLTVEGLAELMADCYWTERDSNARWIWDQLTTAQRTELIGAWPLLRDYAPYLQKIESAPFEAHYHPYYIQPLPLRWMGQADVAKTLEKRAEIYNSLPPLRRENLNIPIEKKMSFIKSKATAAKGEDFSGVRSSPRKLDDVSDVGQLSLEDEESIWQNPDLIPRELMPFVATLVWVAKLPLEARSSILATYSAADLARCWVGPEVALNLIAEALPEKKRRLLQGYSTTVTPNRASKTFKQLSREAALKLISAANGEAQVDSKAA